jgi:hypothetical protein
MRYASSRVSLWFDWNSLNNNIVISLYHEKGTSIFVGVNYTTKIYIRDSEASIATGYVFDGRGVGVWVPVGVIFSFLHVVQAGSGFHPASYLKG